MTDHASPDTPEPPRLRQLRLLVTVLTTTMILGLIVIIALIALTFSRANQSGAPTGSATIIVPDDESTIAVTFGTGWNAVVTKDSAGQERIHVMDRASGEIRQTFEIGH